jgi:crotonobetainyl-CoA:carnitine CoA-transferase CaiB-like acyl-CoA transferase
MNESMLAGLRVVEIADEKGEYAGLVLAGLGADVIKVEPPGGSPSRQIGPFAGDAVGIERSLYFWNYNRGKRSIVLDLDSDAGRSDLRSLLATADIVIDASPVGLFAGAGLDPADLETRFPGLLVARLSAFGDSGPWAGYQGSDLIHLALGGVVMNCGYDPQPDGTYDLPPIAPQMWHSYHIAGESLLIGILGALFHRARTGEGQRLSLAIHEAVSKNTELDLMNWVMRRVPLYRQTCRHAAETVSWVPTIQQTKDGRYFMLAGLGPRDRGRLAAFLARYGIMIETSEPDAGGMRGRPIPGSFSDSDQTARALEAFQRLVHKFTYAEFPWREAQAAGVICVPLRHPEENAADPHWAARGTYTEINHPELDRSFSYVTSKWVSSETQWRPGRRAPLLDEDHQEVMASTGASGIDASPRRLYNEARAPVAESPAFPLRGIRILDFTWFLASAGGTRFLSALGAESIKVEWSAHPDTRMGAMAPVGGREARRLATGPLPGVNDSDMGGQFNNKNTGKRGISLNVGHPRGLEIARELVAVSDIVAEGFSPGVMERWGLGYQELCKITPDIIYAQQSGMGSTGTYGRFRSVGPIAASLSGASAMSGLPTPAMPAGWGYSYLDWIGAYSFATAMLAALYYREVTGKGQWIDASQTESGIFIGGTSILDWSVNGRSWNRYGNRSPFKQAAPHGIYRCAGTDHWIAIACFTEAHWVSLTEIANHAEWQADPRFRGFDVRLNHQDELDALIGEWTLNADRYKLMHDLQNAGVPAGVCQTAEDRVDHDPQLAQLNWLTEVTGTKIGTWPVAEFPVALSKTPASVAGTIGRGAPMYGEDNEYVYGDLLGMTSAEIGKLRDDGVI